MSTTVLGVIIAGGLSSRFGEPKALAAVAGIRIIDRVADSLAPFSATIVVIANDVDIAAAVAWPCRADIVERAGALGGLLTALEWATELDHAGILAVACDMPFVSRPLLALILERARRATEPDIVVPASQGPRGMEPLCAFYSTRCAAPIRAALDREDRRMIGFHEFVVVDRIALEEVRTVADPAVTFMNVNTRDDIERAERLAESIA